MNLILQHWSGPASDFERASWANMREYARACGAEHHVLLGRPVRDWLHFPQMQKMCMLDELLDDYDTVVMADSDMFARPDSPNVFEVDGIGVMAPLQVELRKQTRARVPQVFGTLGYSGDYYGGALYKLRRDERQLFRVHLTNDILRAFDKKEANVDEGVMHYLATMTRTAGRELPEGERWAYSSFGKDVASAHLIHIRRRIKAGEEARRPKEETLAALVKAGIIAL